MTQGSALGKITRNWRRRTAVRRNAHRTGDLRGTVRRRNAHRTGGLRGTVRRRIPCVASRIISPIVFPVFFAVTFASVLLLFPAAARTATLQSVYDAAGPQGGYTKYLELVAGATYTGGLAIPVGDIVCIKGNGATIDLQTSTIQILGKGLKLDVDHCIIKNGGLASAGYTQGALSFVGSSGNVVNNTFYGNTIGIRVYATGPGAVTVMSNIIVWNSVTGLLCQISNEPNVSYNDSWANGTYNYLRDCG
jgi:hypothetical protein